MCPPEMRTRLAEQQAELLRALTGQGTPPPGFAEGRLGAAAEALVRKRCRAVARAWPGLARALGSKFADRIAGHVARTPLPEHGGPLADGRAFALELSASGELPDEGRLELLAVDLHHTRCGDGLVPRRGPALKFAYLRQRRRLVVALRLPWLGEWMLFIPFGRRQSHS